MAKVDLKFATITLVDGFPLDSLGTPLVNNGGGYSTTATTMAVDGITGAVSIGDTFTVATNDTVYTITAHTESGSNTISITFEPGLADSASDDDAINFQPHELEIKIGEGTLTYDEKRKMEYILDRGRLSTVRLGDEEPIDVKFDFIWEFLTAIDDSHIPTIEDVLKKRGEAANWATSAADVCEPYALDVVILYTPDCTGIDPEQITLSDFRWESLAHDFKQGSVAVTGKCNNLVATASRISV